MATTEPSAAQEMSLSSIPSVGRRDWLDSIFRLATSWVGLLTAYAAAVTLALSNIGRLQEGFKGLGLPPWGGMAVVAAIPLLAFVCSTIPAFFEQRRIKRYGEIKVDARAGYFTLRPRDTEAEFERVDRAHEQILRWIENTREPVLYLTGASGTGKSSLLAAWVIPKLTREGHVVIQLRGYEQLLERIKDRILEPDLIWAQPPGRDASLHLLLERACQRLGQRRLILVVDQFEEFLILREEAQQKAFQELLAAKAIGGLTFLLVFRPEYEGLIEDQNWPRLKLDTNRKVISAFTEPAANEFLTKSGLILDSDLARAVLREAAEIDQGTAGLIRPVTLNLCGLVLSRFSGGLPRRFRGGILRGFLRESLLLPEVRDVAEKIIPNLITGNVTKRPRTIAEMAKATGLTRAEVRASMRRLGESDRAIVRPLDEEQETWEISHDFLVSLLDALVARRTVSVWRRVRPLLPWAAAGIVAVVALAAWLVPRPDAIVELRKQGWMISETKEGLVFKLETAIPPESIPILRTLPPPYELDISIPLNLSGDPDPKPFDLSILRALNGLTRLNLSGIQVTDISALRDLSHLSKLDLSLTNVTDLSALRELNELTELDVSGTQVKDISVLRELKALRTLNLSGTNVTDLSALRGLKNLTSLVLSGRNVKVTDISALRELKSLDALYLSNTNLTNMSALRELTNLTTLDLSNTNLADASALQGLTNLTALDLHQTKVTDRDLPALKELKSLSTLNLSATDVTDVSALRELTNLRTLDLSGTKVTDVSSLMQLTGLRWLTLDGTKVTDRDLTALRRPGLVISHDRF